MGRLPAEFAGRKITFRIPFSMPGELVLAENSTGVQFPEATYLHNSDKPFEVHRVIPRVSALDTNSLVYKTDQELHSAVIERMVRVRIYDFSKNENLTKNAQLLTTLTKGSNEKTWEWAEPYTLVRSEGFQVTVDNLATAAILGGSYSKTRFEMAFEGFLIVVAPPSERR